MGQYSAHHLTSILLHRFLDATVKIDHPSAQVVAFHIYQNGRKVRSAQTSCLLLTPSGRSSQSLVRHSPFSTRQYSLLSILTVSSPQLLAVPPPPPSISHDFLSELEQNPSPSQHQAAAFPSPAPQTTSQSSHTQSAGKEHYNAPQSRTSPNSTLPQPPQTS